MNAISRFNAGAFGNVWAATQATQVHTLPATHSLSALLLYGKRLLFPVFDFSPAIRAEFTADALPLPCFFSQLLKNDPLHSAQGLAHDMNILETALGKRGICPASRYEYELRKLEYSGTSLPVKGPPGLLVRRAVITDANALFPLQAGYEQEEVLPQGAQFDPAVCRKGLEYLIAGGTILAAELEGRLVGKININAQSYTCLQIGGVYVLPEWRGRGIAQAMTAALIRELTPQKNRFTLFVKKPNTPARRVYDKLGFVKTGDYRISYY